MSLRFLVPLMVGMLATLSGCGVLGPDETTSGFRKDLLKRVNEIRKSSRSCGEAEYAAAGTLLWNDKLAEAALRHAKDVSLTGREGHTGSDWSGPEDRIRDSGYQFESAGEILATGSSSVSEVMDGFKSSPGHCRVIMNASFTEMGAAIAGGRIWTIVFALPKGNEGL